MTNKNTISGFGPKEAEFVARLSYEKKTIVTAEEIDRLLPAGFKYRNQFVYTLKPVSYTHLTLPTIYSV